MAMSYKYKLIEKEWIEERDFSKESVKESLDDLEKLDIIRDKDSPDYTVGIVEESEYIEGSGVHCVVTIFDENIIKKLEKGLLSISCQLTFDLETDEVDAFVRLYFAPSHSVPADGEFQKVS